MNTHILGIDPGKTNGLVRCSAMGNLVSASDYTSDELYDQLLLWAHNSEVWVMEKFVPRPFVHVDHTPLEVCAVVRSLARRLSVPLREYLPSDHKMLKTRYPLRGGSAHMKDAYSLVQYHIFRLRAATSSAATRSKRSPLPDVVADRTS